MSKRLLVFIYVLAVLIFSGFIANAKQEPLGVSSVKINQKKGVLHLTGQLPTPCFTKPIAVVEKTDEERSQVHLSVVATSTSQICSQVLGPVYKTTIDLNELPLSRGKQYSFIVNNYSGSRIRLTYIAQKDYQDHGNTPEHLFSGILAVDENENFAILKNGEAFQIAETAMELQPHLNREVWIKGFAVPHAGNTDLLPVSVSSLE